MNLAIVHLFIWPELMEPRAKWVGGVALAVLWLAALWETRGELRRQADRRRAERAGQIDPAEQHEAEQQAESDRQLAAVQRLYLGGDWVETERKLLELTKTNPQDIEAQLLLATVWRHLGRTRHAARRLRRIAKLDAAASWRFEIGRELEFIASPSSEPETEGSPAEAA